MRGIDDIPYAEPACTLARPVSSGTPAAASQFGLPVVPVGPYPPASPQPVRLDRFAVASAVCGFVALVPFVSQLLGVAFGAAGLARIRRRRRTGEPISGTGWAVTGILSSGFVLVCWIVVLIAFLLVGSSFSGSAESLSRICPPASAGG